MDSAVFIVRPRGLYMQCDFIFTFSAREAGFAAAESVEIQSAFYLPEAATVTDLWLQVGTDSSRGLILDKGTASSTYEGIVRRRRDPCLLLKESPVVESGTNAVYSRYVMKIYPMLGSGSRTVRFTYLIPVQWRDSGIKVWIPRAMFVMGGSPHETRLLVSCTGNLGSPRLLELPDLAFAGPAVSGAEGWAAGRISSTSIALLHDLTLILDWKTLRGLYFAGLMSKGEQFYQAAVFPNPSSPPRLRERSSYLSTSTRQARGSTSRIWCRRSVRSSSPRLAYGTRST